MRGQAHRRSYKLRNQFFLLWSISHLFTIIASGVKFTKHESNVWCNEIRTILQSDYFRTISSHFFTDSMYIFYKNLVQIVIWRCLTYQKPNWIKSYSIKHNENYFPFLQFCENKPGNLWLKNGHFTTLSGLFSWTTPKSLEKLRFRRSFWGAWWVWISIGSKAMVEY